MYSNYDNTLPSTNGGRKHVTYRIMWKPVTSDVPYSQLYLQDKYFTILILIHINIFTILILIHRKILIWTILNYIYVSSIMTWRVHTTDL